MRRAWPLTTRGTGAIVLAIACFILARPLGLIELNWLGLLLVVLVAASVASLYLRGNSERVSRSVVPEVPTAGREFDVTLRIGGAGRWAGSATRWRDALPGEIVGRAEGPAPVAGAGTDAVLTYSATPRRRGIHRLGPVGLSTIDAFGLARRTRSVGQRTTLTVAPAVVPLISVRAALGERGTRAETRTDLLGQGADNLVARPYAAGDSMRRIHWRATAHRDELMVRQEEQESTPEALVVFDRSLARYSERAAHAPGSDEVFERGVSACVSVLARLIADGFTVTVLDSDGETLAEDVEDDAALESVAVGLATVTARRGDDLLALARRISGGSLGPVVVATGVLSEGDARALSGIAAHASTAIVVAEQIDEGARERLRAAGWRTVVAGGDLARAWADAAPVAYV